MFQFRQFLPILIICSMGNYRLMAADTLKLSGANNFRIPQYLYEYPDCGEDQDVTQIMASLRAGNFRTCPDTRVINRGATSCIHWFALTLSNDHDRPLDYLWNFYNDGIRFTLYELDSLKQRVINEQSLSHRQPIGQRDVPLRTISFRIAMDANETKSLLLKTEIQGRQNLYFPTSISTESDILWYELGFSFLLGRYYGFFLFATIFNLLLYIVLRKKFYGVMFGYIVSLLAFNLVEYLHDAYFVPQQLYGVWSQIPKIVYLALTLFFNVKVFQYFTLNERFLPKMNGYLTRLNLLVLWSTLTFLLLHVAGTFTPLFLYYAQVAFVSVLLIQAVCLLANILMSAWQKTTYIYHYLLGNSLLFAAVILYTINALNIGNIPPLVAPGNIIFAFGFEVVYLMMAFTVKYKRDFERFTKKIAESEEKRKKLTAEIILVQEQERSRIGQDIHDGMGGTLNGLRMLLANERLKEKDKIADVLLEINTEFRGLVHQISPSKMETKGLFGGMEHDLKLHRKNMDISLDFLGDESKLPLDLKIAVFRIYQELLNNALKHAVKATQISISIAIGEDEVRLLVEDDGKRAMKEPSDTWHGGHGLGNIRSRVDYYGGEFQLDPSPSGLTAIVQLPLQKVMI